MSALPGLYVSIITCRSFSTGLVCLNDSSVAKYLNYVYFAGEQFLRYHYSVKPSSLGETFLFVTVSGMEVGFFFFLCYSRKSLFSFCV